LAGLATTGPCPRSHGREPSEGVYRWAGPRAPRAPRPQALLAGGCPALGRAVRPPASPPPGDASVFQALRCWPASSVRVKPGRFPPGPAPTELRPERARPEKRVPLNQPARPDPSVEWFRCSPLVTGRGRRPDLRQAPAGRTAPQLP